jgi:hypothetical protein
MRLRWRLTIPGGRMKSYRLGSRTLVWLLSVVRPSNPPLPPLTDSDPSAGQLSVRFLHFSISFVTDSR